MRNTSSFVAVDSFRVKSPHGAPKVGFGYGIIHNGKVYVYVQEDPCPYQIVMVGPKNEQTGQYEYIVMTNWAKFPLVAMTRDLGQFDSKYRDELTQRFRSEGYTHEFSEIIGNSMHHIEWTKCRPLTPIAFVSNVINRILFGS
ncbi:unnamed protein product [Gongylonema pulchrum]|uniref:Cyanocobalamin reductase (cyanide-eliminating) n=1 Tax=Gongylonema pulchrum TaxID=637853 RepID=A0A183D7W3_9BILA|nr:unnamed protein product [Gongylonema pulchrum]